MLYPPWLFLQSNEAILLRLCTPHLNISDSQSASLKRAPAASVFSAPLMCTVSAASPFLLCSLCSVLIRVLDNESWTVGGTFAAQLTPTSGQSRGENELGSGWIKHVSQDVALFPRFPGAQSLLVPVDPLRNQKRKHVEPTQTHRSGSRERLERKDTHNPLLSSFLISEHLCATV